MYLFIRLFNFFNSFVLVLLLLTANLWLIFKFTVSLANKSDELNMKKITIAIDGFSSCGKSTMAKDLAREVGYIYIDSGAMYRAVTLYSIENGIFNGDVIDTEKLKEAIRDIRITFRPNPETGRPDTYLNGVNVENKIRTMGVSSKVSPISALDFVREAMVAQQQAMGKEKGIVMIEQPMPKEQLDDIAWVTQQSPLPVFADESIQRLKDIVALRGAFTGINIKLMKCTGMREAWKMVTLAHALGMRVMVGCMTETSCAISAASQFSPLVDFADLDGNLLISNDRFKGVEVVRGKITLNDLPGIGVMKI